MHPDEQVTTARPPLTRVGLESDTAANVRAAAPSLGMLAVGADFGGAEYGAVVAIGELNRALWRYGAIERLQLFAQEFSLAQVRKALDHAIGSNSTRREQVIVEPVGGFAEQSPPAVWHDAGADVVRPFRMRDAWAHARGAWFPITITHHTISYQRLVHGFYLPLILDATALDAIVCTSRAARDAMTSVIGHVCEQLGRAVGTKVRFRGRLEVIPLGVNTDVFHPQDGQAAKRTLGVDVDTFVLLWNGRVSFVDKADLLPMVRVLRTLVDANPTKRLRLIVAGGARPAEKAHEAIREYAQHLGVADAVITMTDTDRQLRPTLYAAADVFVSPVDNVQETFGLTPLEAMACGVPQVVSDWNGYRDSVVHGETGFLVPTYWLKGSDQFERIAPIVDRAMTDHLAIAQTVAVDVQSLQSHLQELLHNDECRMRMRAASRQRAVERFGWRRVISEYDALWGELAAARRPPLREPPRWYVPHFQSFHGYASRVVSGEMRVRPTAAGRRLLRGEEELPSYALRGGLIDLSLSRAVLQAVNDAGMLSLDEIGGGVIDAAADEGERPHRHAMWLVKYGFLEIIR
jgi:glycosyltransferase involved in cell wall biosynthesis